MSDTLRILHLPPQLSDERRSELFQRYGATKTRTLRPSRKHTVTFAKFPSQEAATEALLRLHQLNVRGQRLSVEIAKKSILSEVAAEREIRQDESLNEGIRKELANRSHFQAFLQKLNGWALNQVFSQPPPPNIRYKYTPPTRSTLLRIAMQLLKEPAFYTQVLHLMNKMNLPPPYSELESEFPMLKQMYNMEKYEDVLSSDLFGNKEDRRDLYGKGGETEAEGEKKEEQEEESEIETDNENDTKPIEIVPTKRKRSQSTKRLKIPKFANPATQMLGSTTSTQNIVKPEDMFEQIHRGESRNMKIELKMVNKLSDGPRTTDSAISNNVTDGGFGLMFPASKSGDTDEYPRRDVITAKELADNRISVNDQRLLPVFKNYHPGKPSNRLYIKNLAKHVEVKDLHFIYRKYLIPESKEAEFEYDVRLMQEGRMKGQAFVSLQNTMQAHLALEETNGYILKDKPMVVQFAKVSKT